MKTIEDRIEAINELIQFNNDRVEGYEKASEEAEAIDVDLKALFTKMGNDSRSYRKDLSSLVTRLGGTVETDTSTTADIHRAWIDFKSAITGNSRDSILSSCEFGEEAIVKAYDAVLENTSEFSHEAIALISEQRNGLRVAQEAISDYRKVNNALS